MFIVNLENEKVNVADRSDAKAITNILTDMNCNKAMRTQNIIGNKFTVDFGVEVDGTQVSVIDQEDVQTLVRWMLDYGCKEIVIRRTEHEKTV